MKTTIKVLKWFVFRAFFIAFFFTLPQATQGAQTQTANVKRPPAKRLVLKTVNRFRHDENAYTQGLIFHEGFLYESTGQHGQSSIRKVEIATGKVLQKTDLRNEFFGEGIERIGNTIYMLTWENEKCFLFDLETLQFQKTFTYRGEGWGLTLYKGFLVQSDGSPTLKFFDPKDFTVKKRITVQNNGVPLRNLNELEMVEHELWANIWGLDQIARIDPDSGHVLGWINCANFVPKEFKNEHNNLKLANSVLNGIAYDPEKKRVYITGKNWPWLYELSVEFQ